VCEAQDTLLSRTVAIKFLSLGSVGTHVAAFLAEGQIVAKLDFHPGVVRVLDVGRTDQYCYLVYEFIPGGDLRTKMSNRRRLTYEKSVDLIASVADALHFAHEHQLVHRDIKPANILVQSERGPVIADFGTALRLDVDRRAQYSNPGTPAYMSPEQRAGAESIDRRTDIYSLGVVMHELLTGSRPSPTPDLGDSVPDELKRVCTKCLQQSPEHRYQTALELAIELRKWVADLKSISGRFFKLLTSNPDVSELRSFLCKNPQVIERAFAADVNTKILSSISLGGEVLDICIGNLMLTTGQYAWSVLLLGRLSGDLLGSIEGSVSRLSALRGWILQNLKAAPESLPDFNATFNATVVVGRRTTLSEIVLDRIRTLNEEFNRIRTLNEDCLRVRVRTYDWLMDIALSLTK
jgi:serine/threonine-protein kinase